MQQPTHLYVEQMQLYWVVCIDVLIRKEELLPQGEYDGLVYKALLSESRCWIQPGHCSMQKSAHIKFKNGLELSLVK